MTLYGIAVCPGSTTCPICHVQCSTASHLTFARYGLRGHGTSHSGHGSNETSSRRIASSHHLASPDFRGIPGFALLIKTVHYLDSAAQIAFDSLYQVAVKSYLSYF